MLQINSIRIYTSLGSSSDSFGAVDGAEAPSTLGKSSREPNSSPAFLRSSKEASEKEITFYDSVTGKPLYIAPRGRTWKEFVVESKAHGWPSFRY